MYHESAQDDISTLKTPVLVAVLMSHLLPNPSSSAYQALILVKFHSIQQHILIHQFNNRSFTDS